MSDMRETAILLEDKSLDSGRIGLAFEGAVLRLPPMKTSSLFRHVGSIAAQLFARPASRSAQPAVVRPNYSRPEPLEERFVLSSFVVTNLNNSGPGSLRAAVNKANLAADVDSITFQAGLTGPIVLLTGELSITQPVSIVGPGANIIKVSGHDTSRVFEIAAGKTVAISGITIMHGNSGAGAGGGVLNQGILTMTNDIFDSNRVTGAAHGGAIENTGAGSKLFLIGSKVVNNTSDEGGGIFNELGATAALTKCFITTNHGSNSGDGAGIRNIGDMSIRFSTISDNVGTGTSFFGGGIRNDGNLSIIASTIAHNIAQGRGGGIYNSATLNITISTIVNNIAIGSLGGGGIQSAVGSLTVNNSTVTGNVDASSNASGAGGIAITGGTLAINNTVVAGNFATGANSPDLRGAVASGSGNFIGIGDAGLTGITNGVNSNQIGTVAVPIDPKLGPLQNNGGFSLTRLPLIGSPLINKGVNAVIPAGLTTDQRGLPRFHASIVDIGATEL